MMLIIFREKELAKDLVRKCRLGTIGENELVNILEAHMYRSREFYENIKKLVNK